MQIKEKSYLYQALNQSKEHQGVPLEAKVKYQKAGSKIYRGTLFMAAMVAIRYNDEIKVFYDRLKDNGKHTTVAQVAVMKKLIIISHSMYKNNCVYDKEFYKRQCGYGKKIVVAA